MKLCIITCYNQPDYIRARTLRSAASLIDDVEVIAVKNSRTGLLRYAEVFIKVLRARLRNKPDAYLLTFRGYEMLLPIRLLSMGKPLIYDEFVNPIEWVVHEQRQVEAKQGSNKLYSAAVSFVSKLIVAIVASGFFTWAYRKLVSSVDLILTDTDSHAEISTKITGIDRNKIMGLHVGTDEEMFNVADTTRPQTTSLSVFYYGNMLPLHGVNYVIEAAIKLKDEPVKLTLIGGSAAVAREVEDAIKKGANIDYQSWVGFETLPTRMREADLCLAGPFGDTFQARYVITGKAYQYLAMGRPTIIGQNEESAIFTNKKDVLIVPQADSSAIAETIRWAMNHRKELEAIGKEGRELYEREFSVRTISKRLEKALASL